MYADHYGFSEKPFNLTPDPKFLYPSARHAEAFAHLEFGRRERGGFVVITGEVGTGKTTLARSFLSKIDDETATAVVLYPALTAVELLRSILDDLHIEAAGDSLKDQIDALSGFLLEARRRDRNVVLLIDEAQDLSPEVLEQIRLISNLETDTEKLLTIVLMGQSELREMLARPELRQLAQRVTAWYHITPLDRPETEDYVRHRLRIAGGSGKVEFTPASLAAVHRASHGIPRVINLIADRALLAGYVDGTRSIDAPLVARAAREVQGGMPTRRRPLWAAVAAGGLLLIVALGFWTRSPMEASGVDAGATQPAGIEPPAARSPATEPLEPLVLEQAGALSYQAAVRAVGDQWPERPTQRTELRTHLDALRRIDLPAILEMFHPARPGTSFVALLTIDGESARVVGADAAARWVELGELDRLWTRRAVFLWRDYDAVAESEDPADVAAWVRRSLDRLGYIEEGVDLQTAVTRFQGDAELAPDGLVGERTLMALYARGAYPRPRLSTGGTMSVIFDALNKLDKEKRTRKTGMLIVGAPSLSGRRGAAGARLSGTAALALVLLGAAGWWWTRDAPSTGPAPPPPPTRQTAATREAARSRPTPTGDSAPVRPSDLAVIPAAPATDASEAGPDTAAEPAAEPAASELAPRPEPAQLQLEAITLRDNGPVAIVSGRLVREGDVFDGIRVVRIGQTEVELFVQAEERTLVLRF